MTTQANKKAYLYRRLLKYIFPYKHFLFISVIGFAIFATMEALLMRTIGLFVNTLEGKPTDWVQHFPVEISQSILFIPLLIISVSIIRGIGSYFGNFYMSRVGLNVVNSLRREIFSHLVYLPKNYFDQKNSGEIISLVIYNIEQVTGSVTNAVKILIRDGFSVIAFLSLMLYLNWKLTIVFFVAAPILAALVYVAGRYFRRMSLKIQKAIGKVTHITNETVQGISLVKSYNGEEYEVKRFNQATDDNLSFGTKFERVSSLQTPVMHIVIAAALAVIFLLVLLFWPSGDAAGAIEYVTVAGVIAKPFRQLANVNAIIQRGLAASETIFETLDIEKEKESGKKELHNVRGEIVFNKVSFNYDKSGKNNKALNNLDLRIEPGQTVALVGQSGSGKSTIASLLLRFYQQTQGSITIDGIEIDTLSLKNLREHVALVNQQTILFNDSITRNITYGKTEDSINQEALQSASKQAYASHFIDKLDDGLDTFVGEDGSSLSGGQRQRIAIARALYKNAPILILDEATSALDNESEKQVQEALDTLKEGRTTIVIAHRLSTIESADKIVVLDQGRLIESGTHQELLDKKGYYANLHQTHLNQPADTTLAPS